jgi:hypothetical protein
MGIRCWVLPQTEWLLRTQTHSTEQPNKFEIDQQQLTSSEACALMPGKILCRDDTVHIPEADKIEELKNGMRQDQQSSDGRRIGDGN